MSNLHQKIERIQKLKEAYRRQLQTAEPLLETHLNEQRALESAQMDFKAEEDKVKMNPVYMGLVQKGCVAAAQMVIDKVQSGEPLTVDFIRDLHTCILNPVNPENAGQWRTTPARWKNSTMIVANHAKILPLMYETVDGLNHSVVPAFYWEEAPNLEWQAFSAHPLMKAIQMNYNIVATHPFNDGNKRLAKAVSNYILRQAGYAPMSIGNRERYIVGVENYFETRTPNIFYDTMFREIEFSQRKALALMNRVERADVQDKTRVLSAETERIRSKSEHIAGHIKPAYKKQRFFNQGRG